MPGQGLSTAMRCRAGLSTLRQDPDGCWAALSCCSPLCTLLASPFLPHSLCPHNVAFQPPPGLASHTQGVGLKHPDPNPCTDVMGQWYSLPLGASISPRQHCLMLGCSWAPSHSRGPAERGWVCSLFATLCKSKARRARGAGAPALRVSASGSLGRSL